MSYKVSQIGWIYGDGEMRGVGRGYGELASLCDVAKSGNVGNTMLAIRSCATCNGAFATCNLGW